ncbi:AsnC family transcriptional regulator [Paenibacillus cellulosilyticus]|uniref:AsnC family transcriptional regulator n=1 Tax=Paenibacillus cellulosilyticus TaxID=375489 RepID=A0A2V2YQW2_9BACL|nr:Lrp/AsnC family transcriptional regulator [Paenibacillus cellulosilyticus]PWV98690.1 AsnC family transcriptional regulator [Paenibacillus cellulosilyticus]QKS43807.1 Lrp/AsnC family transcriptional regulator [Paenibacillus cellulosilyticus]
MEHGVDETDLRIMRLLQHNARISISQISLEVSMSQPSVRERIRRLEEKEIISGYTAVFRQQALDRGTTAFLLVKTEHCQALVDYCDQAPSVTDMYRISGEYNYLITVQTATIEEVSQFQDSIMKFGPSKSLIGLKSLIENRIML